MKKTLTIILALVVVLLVVTAVYRFAFRKSIPDAPLQEQVVSILKQNDCFVCHSSASDKPFYATFPLIGTKMEEHILHAVRFTDLEAAFADPAEVNEVALAMVEHSITADNMPLGEYRMIHWGTGFSGKEKAVLSEWVKNTRMERFSNGLACEALSNEPVYPVPDAIPVDAAKADLGFRMYNDGRISLDGTISCASCHILKDGGADEHDERTSQGIDDQFGGVNAPTVYNSYFNIRQFWNGRAADLQEQAAGPPVNPVEMGNQTWDDIVARLRKDKALVKEFETLYPGEGLTQATVTGAIAEFEKTLLTPDSRFDLYLKGDANAITPEELKGYQAFKENGCATCHTGVILGGRSFEYLGVFGDYFADRNPEIVYNGDDDGLKGFTSKESDLHKFKVPGLRNVVLTAPYFHDGSMQTLEEAVSAMAKYELGKELSADEVAVMVSFMNTLTGKNSYLAAE